MQPLDPKYRAELDEIIEAIQEAEELQAWLENEEEADYNALRELYEQVVADLYKQVAMEAPLQLRAFEDAVLDERIEGLFLPKLLGYTVLRDPVNAQCQYYYPQEDFRKVLLAICNSANFEELKKRIGQTVQIGFALSSDIWVTNLLDSIDNKAVRAFLNGQRMAKYHDPQVRRESYRRYALQFKNDVFFSTEFPSTSGQMQKVYPSFAYFLEKRVKGKLDNSSLTAPIAEVILSKELQGSQEHLTIAILFMNFFNPEKSIHKHVSEWMNNQRSNQHGFATQYFQILADLHKSGYDIDAESDRRAASYFDTKIQDDLNSFYKLVDVLHLKGYVHSDVIESVGAFYGQHEGVSQVNECVRLVVFRYLDKLMGNLSDEEYPEMFEVSKVVAAYFKVFDNEHFKQDVERLFRGYLTRLLTTYTDKRGKDYQDIKRFAQTSFVDLGFLTEREVVEIFKTKRKSTPQV